MTELRCMMPFTLVAALSAALAAGCSKTPEPATTSTPEQAAAPKPAASSAAAPNEAAAPKEAPPEPKGPTEIAWDAPAAWESAPNPSAMRKATYKIKHAPGDSEDAEVSVSQAGGSVEMNIQRWEGQFETKGANATKKSQLTVNDLKVTTVELHGTFNGSGMPGMPAAAPKAGYALLGAIVETPGGASWFFKMTGPEKTVSGAKGDFDKLVHSLRPK